MAVTASHLSPLTTSLSHLPSHLFPLTSLLLLLYCCDSCLIQNLRRGVGAGSVCWSFSKVGGLPSVAEEQVVDNHDVGRGDDAVAILVTVH